jgi:hypothetical protein
VRHTVFPERKSMSFRDANSSLIRLHSSAVRYFRKNKVFSLLNILALAMGLACCMLIALFVFDELRYDRYPAFLTGLVAFQPIFEFYDGTLNLEI